VATARSTPFDDSAALPLADRPAPSRWPVLARIAVVRALSERELAREVPPAPASHRVDPPHVVAPPPLRATPSPLQVAAPVTARPAEKPAREPQQPASRSVPPTPAAQPADRALPAAPLAVRVATEAWQAAEPHRAILRFAAMLALMAAGGMSMAMLMHERVAPTRAPADSIISTAREKTGADVGPQHVELAPVLEPVLVPAVAPATDTSSQEPTASGPLAPPSPPVMAVESVESAVESNEAPTAAPYPTTSYAEVHLPSAADDCSLPRVRTTEPEVAHLRGDVLPTQTR
jgi:hypothetical protein